MPTDPFFRLFLSLVLYVLLLFFIRFIGYGSKKSIPGCTNCCPKCEKPLERIKRKTIDKILFHVTFRIFNCKRYSCNACKWEGLRWEEKFTAQT